MEYSKRWLCRSDIWQILEIIRKSYENFEEKKLSSGLRSEHEIYSNWRRGNDKEIKNSTEGVPYSC